MAETVQQLLCERAEDDRIGVRYGDRTWTWRAHLAEAGEQAAAVLALLDPARPPHVGAMLGNAPDMLRAMAAAALGGYVLVGLNTTRRGEQVPHIFPIFSGSHLVDRFSITGDDVCYVSMPLFHSNSVVAGWAVAATSGASIVPARFSASRLLDDVRHFGATYLNYVGKPLAYVLATPPRADDADNPLRVAFGNEASDRDIEEFARRFDCQVMAALVLHEDALLAPAELTDFLAAQPDLPGHGWPRYVRIAPALPSTATNKVLKRELIRQGATAGDGVLWVREERGTAYQPVLV
ncbi:MAG TPA: hypothetical protein DEQ43_06165 [Nocardioides bacterium]|uniref:AMP-binding protein n=1 Tax=uncultured Nocardioides sp. TaxID=198441 RepID=UPI000EC1B30D|nr:AMP-binding protein [uncultured Nocardioides sp.]HCB03821.1 hypothetical protein [Nocardioides sp.]